MPIYEFYCPENNKLYSFFARSLAFKESVPRCPENSAFSMERRVSSFAIVGKAKEESVDDPFSQIDDTRMEALMADMEHEMTAMDESNPDPKQLGRFMRKMTDLMGDRTPEAIREMVSRLEAGEDPDKLEEQYGHFADGDAASGEGAAADALWDTVRKKIRHLRNRPVRDPKLYEMADFV